MIPRQRRYEIEQEFADWMRANPQYIENKVQSFKLFGSKPALRRVLPVEPPAHCYRCGCHMALYSFKFRLFPGCGIDGDGKDDQGEFAMVTPIERVCRKCDDEITEELRIMYSKEKTVLKADKVRRKCPTCDGKDKDCKTCNGFGKIWVKVKGSKELK